MRHFLQNFFFGNGTLKVYIKKRSDFRAPCIYNIPNLVFNFLKYYRRPRTPLIRLSVCLSACLSRNQPEGQIIGWRKQQAKDRMLCQPALSASLLVVVCKN